MNKFSEKRTAGYTVVIGCGRLGANLADRLSDEGQNVLVIDKDKQAFRKLNPSYGGLVIIGDGTDFEVLTEAQLETADVVVVVTDDDNTNVMIAQMAREIFKVPRVIARLYDPDRECSYQEFGIASICPAILSAQRIDYFLQTEPVTASAGRGLAI